MSVKASVDFIGIAPVLDQNNSVTGAEVKVTGYPPFVLESPVNGGAAAQVQANHAPQFSLRQNASRLFPRQINDRAGAHPESVAFVHRDAEGLVSAPRARVKHTRQMLERRVEEADYRAPGADHAHTGADHSGAQDSGQVVERRSRMGGAREMREHPGAGSLLDQRAR